MSTDVVVVVVVVVAVVAVVVVAEAGASHLEGDDLALARDHRRHREVVLELHLRDVLEALLEVGLHARGEGMGEV